MIHALLHGKSDDEDHLTAVAFGLLELLPTLLLWRWLCEARNLANEPFVLRDDERGEPRLHYWPTLVHRGRHVIPDLHVALPTRELFVEVKLGAGLSGSPSPGPTIDGQLGRQWMAARERWPQRPLALIYLTADYVRPDDVMEAIAELERDAPHEAEAFRRSLYWLSWRALTSKVRALARPDDPQQAKLVDLVRRVLEHHRLDSYRGTSITRVNGPAWRYRGLRSSST
jgi:hypothetical protein